MIDDELLKYIKDKYNMIDENLFIWAVKDRFGEIARFIFHSDAEKFIEIANAKELSRHLYIDGKLLKKEYKATRQDTE